MINELLSYSFNFISGNVVKRIVLYLGEESILLLYVFS